MAISLAEGLGGKSGAKPRSHVNAPSLRRASSSRVPPSQQPTKRRACPTMVHPATCLLMTTRAAIRVFVALFLASVVSLRAQDHPRAPQQSQSQQLPQSAGGAPQAAMTEATMSSVSAGLKEFISGSAAKSADKKFHMPYQPQGSRVGTGQSSR